MKRFAICLNGNIEFWDTCKDSFINNILEKAYPVIPDIFIHLYSKKSSKTDISIIEKKFVFVLSSGQKISPTKIIIENEGAAKRNVKKDVNELYKYGDKTSIDMAFLELKSMNNAYKLMKEYESQNSLEYDIIMISKLNVKFEEEINLEDIKNENTFYMIEVDGSVPNYHSVIGLPKGIEVYASLFDEMFISRNEQVYIGSFNPSEITLLLRHCCIKNKVIGDWGWTGYKKAVLCSN